MKNILICVGHGKAATGGYDPGAVYGSYHEYRIARDIANGAYDALKGYNCNVTIINLDEDMYLYDRIRYANNGGYDLVVEIHLNAGRGTGTEVYYAKSDKGGKEMAKAVSQAIASHLGIKNRGAKTKTNDNGRDYFAIIRETNATALLVETCFIDSKDLAKVDSKAQRRDTGKAIAAAIVARLRLEKKQTAFVPYKVKVICKSLNIRKTPVWGNADVVGTVKKGGVYTIVAEKMLGDTKFGVLKSGVGCISLGSKYVRRL